MSEPHCESCGSDVSAFELDTHGGLCEHCFGLAIVESERWKLALDLERLDLAQLRAVGRLVDDLLCDDRSGGPGDVSSDEGSESDDDN